MVGGTIKASDVGVGSVADLRIELCIAVSRQEVNSRPMPAFAIESTRMLSHLAKPKAAVPTVVLMIFRTFR